MRRICLVAALLLLAQPLPAEDQETLGLRNWKNPSSHFSRHRGRRPVQFNSAGGNTWAWHSLPERGAVPAQLLSPKEVCEGFVSLFDGKTLAGWQGDLEGYPVEDGTMVCRKGKNIYTNQEYADFILRFEFKLPPGGNNGVGIRTPATGRASYAGMEIQILDEGHPKYKNLKPYQFHGSIYGVVPAERGHLKPVGEWNSEEIVARGSQIKVTVNGAVVLDADLSKIDQTMDHKDHPGLHNAKGHIGWLGHGDPVAFRQVRIKELK